MNFQQNLTIIFKKYRFILNIENTYLLEKL